MRLTSERSASQHESFQKGKKKKASFKEGSGKTYEMSLQELFHNVIPHLVVGNLRPYARVPALSSAESQTYICARI